MKKLSAKQKKTNTAAIAKAQAAVRKPTKAEIAAADEYMARTSKGKRKPVTPQVAAISGTAPLGAALALANGDPAPKTKATKRGTTAEAKRPSKATVTKVIDQGPFFASKEATKSGSDELRLKKGSARFAVMSALLKAGAKGVTREALEKVAEDQVSQAVRVLRIVGHVAK